MAVDATGTPTPLGIPKFNPTSDAPSGLGSNAQMDFIDGLLTQAPRSGSIAGIAVGSVPVWNGSGWVKPGGTPSGTKFLRDDGTWAPAVGGTLSSWSPTKITQDGSDVTNVAHTVNNGRYIQLGNLVYVTLKVSFTGAGTVSQAITVHGLPVSATGALNARGVFHYGDSGTTIYVGSVTTVSTTQLRFQVGSQATPLGVTPSFAIASGDDLALSIWYEA